jgi:hypothetical protein
MIRCVEGALLEIQDNNATGTVTIVGVATSLVAAQRHGRARFLGGKWVFSGVPAFSPAVFQGNNVAIVTWDVSGTGGGVTGTATGVKYLFNTGARFEWEDATLIVGSTPGFLSGGAGNIDFAGRTVNDLGLQTNSNNPFATFYYRYGTVREELTANRTYYVDAGLGSDSNDGLSSGAGAWATVAHASAVISALDIGTAFTVTLVVAAGPTSVYPAWIFAEVSTPDAPPTGYGTAFFRDNGSGKMQYAVRFPTGAVQVLATEP